jgi:hypothetical protein
MGVRSPICDAKLGENFDVRRVVGGTRVNNLTIVIMEAL